MQHPVVRDHALEEKLLGEYEMVEEQANLYWKQRSRVQWHHEGDRNTRFFHTVATNRRRHNLITMVKKEDDSLTGDENFIKERFLSYFKDLYCPTDTAQNTTQKIAEVNQARNFIFEKVESSSNPTIPSSAHQRITATPNYHEVKRVLFEMGPDKSSGPDGITARFLQQNWHVVGSEVFSQIKKIFQEEEVPDDWLKCHVTLIPKSAEPQTPAEYRPISVGNIFYRLVMKLIANRLRPHLTKVISKEQNAFVKWRSIADNIILVKEILHYFTLASFKKQAFLLKADVNKAFDKLDWNFLQRAMLYINVPHKIIKLIISSYKRAKVTIKINGKGDGFLQPTQGLRQGCPMSPYIFIICMEILSRILQVALNTGSLKGVQVAATSPVLTHAVYADDLILMGDAAEGETQTLTSLLHAFADASGLHINPIKSKLWFSRKCTAEIVARVQNVWGAGRVEGQERYLGVMIDERGDIKKNGLMLLEKMKKKLTGWKSQMLSHAGRLVLIKAVLMSMPVYAMSLEILPKSIVKEMNSLIAKFFWGKVGQQRYMSLIAWKKACAPAESGGLGVKDLQTFGEALFMKVVWSLMAEEDKLWVQVCKSKYYPVAGYWRAKNNGGCTKMWSQVLKYREFFSEQVVWKIGNGDKVHALSQPWFQNWTIQEGAANRDMQRKVSSLLLDNTGQWNMQELPKLFTPDQVRQIISENNVPLPQSVEQDILIWKRAKSGKYSVKEGYKMMTGVIDGQSNSNYDFDWHAIWKWKSLSPKIKIFLWRLVHRGLPMAVNMHARMSNFSPICQRCAQENEFEMHCLFFCNTSRQVWFGSLLGLRVHELPMDIGATVQLIMSNLHAQGVRIFATTMWEVWKERNKTVIEHKVFQPRSVIQRVNAGLWVDSITTDGPRGIAGGIIQERYDYNGDGCQEKQVGHTLFTTKENYIAWGYTLSLYKILFMRRL
ncbi:RNA-directed DNA polymerase (reverse transcriptase)-related family protein [Rhynchospora pubera]|uniref:RNA-directed DNA polymerase (Reverse transcriptase)-related family protein n=1 Tax=Rhynchospora pubera TaxID=906938 RepID=A0AAV8CK46_9POAL|nr:RNA-directed DNA polymerase (reverse transcriptase)-related family protein [Rhynchospora pubera]